MKFQVVRVGSLHEKFAVEIDCQPWLEQELKYRLAVAKALDDWRWDFRCAYLAGADLRGLRLTNVDLSGADLSRADLTDADLTGANLSGANLTDAVLVGADLSYADLVRTTLRRADMRNASLYQATLSRADIRYADLTNTRIRSTCFFEARLYRATVPEIIQAQTWILPDGAFDAWKQCREDVLVKVRIPAKARRSNAAGREARAEYVKVLEVVGADIGVSYYDPNVIYRKGEVVRCHAWCENRWFEDAGGIHFFLTREEAMQFRFTSPLSGLFRKSERAK